MRVPRHLSGILLAFVVAGCASGPRGDRTPRCEGCRFAAALAQVIGAFADIDA